jgi:hypothetical protein
VRVGRRATTGVHIYRPPPVRALADHHRAR